MAVEPPPKSVSFWTAFLCLAGAPVSLVAGILKLHAEVKQDDRSEKEEGR